LGGWRHGFHEGGVGLRGAAGAFFTAAGLAAALAGAAFFAAGLAAGFLSGAAGVFGCCHIRASLTNTWKIAQLIAPGNIGGDLTVCNCFSRFSGNTT
jgi:hypothetical protein